MSARRKVLLGLLTIAPPILFIVYFLVSVFSFFAIAKGMDDGGMQQSTGIFFVILYVLFFLFIIIATIGTLVYYIIDINSLNPNFKNDTSNNKVLWILVVLFTGFIGKIAYFIIEVYPRPETLDASA